MMKEIRFTVYEREYYDKIFSEIAQIDKSWNPKRINEFIQRRISLTTMFTYTLSEVASQHFPIYRARAINLEKGDTIDESKISSFGYPPKQSLKCHGRANRKGQQVFYASGDPHTPFHEISEDIKVSSTIVYVSKWGLKEYPGPVYMRNLFFGIPVDTENYASIMAGGLNEKFEEMFAGQPENIKELYRYGQSKYADLFLSQGKQLYHVTSSIVHDTFVDAMRKGISMPIITYPSVAKQRESVNFVFRKDFVDKYFYLQHVFKVKVTALSDETVNTEIISIGLPFNGEMRWVSPKSSIVKVDYSQAVVFTDKNPGGRKLLEDEGLTVCCEQHKMTLQEFLDKTKVSKEAIIEEVIKTPLTINTMDKVLLGMTTTGVAETTGTVYIHNKIAEEGRISKIEFPINSTIQYN